jgi:hypothetical protein
MATPARLAVQFDERATELSTRRGQLATEQKLSAAAKASGWGLLLRRVVFILVISVASLTDGCGGRNSSQGPPVPSINSVTVTPPDATVAVNGTQQFSATVTGTGAFSTAVSWTVDGAIGGGPALGTVTAAGLYTAPSFAPAPSTVTITATSTSDTSKSGKAQASITGQAVGPVTVTVSPPTAVFGPGQQGMFAATVQGNGTFDHSVIWSVNGTVGGTSSTGTITSSGTYAAPSSLPSPTNVTVIATTVATPTQSGTASVSLVAGPTITSVSPAQGRPGDEIQISGDDLGSALPTVVFSGPNGVGIAVPAFTSTINVAVPLQAESGPLFVQVQDAKGNIVNTNTLPFTRLPDLRIRTDQKDLAIGESANLHVVTFGGSTPTDVVWSTDQGTVSSGRYDAPRSLQSDTYAHISGCIQGTQTCDTLLIGLHPFRLDPAVPVLALGGALQLQAIVNGTPVSATWAQITGGGTLSSNGMYTAASSPPDGGSTVISAAYQSVQEESSIGVTGAFPGLVNRVYDYLDLSVSQIQRVTNALSVAVSGTKVYVLAAQDDSAALGRKFYYIDVYDLADPVRPQWISTVEAAAAGQLYAFGSVLYDIHPNGLGNSIPSAMAAYDISGPTPILIARRLLPNLFGWSFYAGTLTATEQSSYNSSTAAVIDQFSMNGENLAQHQITVPPALSGASYSLGSVGATQNRLYLTEQNNSSSGAPGILAAYDISSASPTLIGTVQLPQTTLTADSFISNSFFLTDQLIFDITKDPPILTGQWPETIAAVDADATRILGTSLQNGIQNGLRVIDVSDPSNARTAETLFDRVQAFPTGALSANVVYSPEGIGGLAVYDIGAAGGPHFQSQLGTQNPGGFVAVAQVANSTTLFAAGFSIFSGGLLTIYDLQQATPVQIAQIPAGASSSNDLALVGNDLFVGTDQNLVVFDVSQPSSPNQVGSVNVPINALVASGNTLFAGSSDGRLIVYNIATPSSPVTLASIALPDKAIQMVNQGTLLFVADRIGGLLIFDVSSASNPTLVSKLSVSPAVIGIQVDGTLAFLAGLESGLVIVEVTNPVQPNIVSQTPLDSYDPFDAGISLFLNRASAIAIVNGIAFVGAMNFDPSVPPNNGNGMVYGFDFKQPSHPRLVSLCAEANTVSGGVTSLFATAASLFVSGPQVGLIEIDAAQPRNTVNLFYPPTALRPNPATPPPLPMLQHPRRPKPVLSKY